MASVWEELKRRKVFQVAVVYAVMAWLIIQIIDVVSEPLSLPGWLDTVVIVLLGVGFPIAVIVAWAFESRVRNANAESRALAPGAQPLAISVHTHAVGRDGVLEEMAVSYESVVGGRGQLLGVVGEAGIGKTTAAENFLAGLIDDNDRPALGRGQCSERLAGTEAYLPVLEALESLLSAGDAQGLHDLMKSTAPNWYRLVLPHSSVSNPPAAFPSPEWLKRELSAFLHRLCEQRPVVLFFEDLHWADESTIDLLAYVADRMDKSRLLILLTYRSEEMLLNRHLFAPLKLDLMARGKLREIELEFLSERNVAQYLDLEYPQHRFPVEFVTMLHQRTEGSPLFVSDLLGDLRDRGVIAERDGEWQLRKSVDVVQRDLPQSVQAMIERKIGRLDEDDRGLLDVAAVQGFEFHACVVAEVSSSDIETVELRLQAIENSHGLIKHVEDVELPDRALTPHYRFMHVLYQNALYGALSSSRKASLSLSVAEKLVEHYSDEREEIASELAALFDAARRPDIAAGYYDTAAQRAAQRAASAEAVALAKRGIALLDSIDEDARTAKMKFHLQTVLVTGLALAKGWVDPEVIEACARAMELAGEDEDPRDLHISLLMLLFNAWASRDISRLDELIRQHRRLAERIDDPVVAVHQYFIDSQEPTWGGRFTEAVPLFERAIASYEPGQDPTACYRYGQDPGIVCRSYASWIYCLAGFPNRPDVLAPSRAASSHTKCRSGSHVGRRC